MVIFTFNPGAALPVGWFYLAPVSPRITQDLLSCESGDPEICVIKVKNRTLSVVGNTAGLRGG